MSIKTAIFVFLFALILTYVGCRSWFHAECRSNYQINRGKIEASLVYNCLIQDPDAKGDTIAYTRKGQWDSLWINLHAKNGTGCPQPTIDFTQNSVLTFFQIFETTYKTIREVNIDNANKQVVYTITLYKCKSGKGSLSMNENMVVIPKIPSGYSVVWKTAKK